MNERYSERKILFRANDEGVIHTSNESINASQAKIWRKWHESDKMKLLLNKRKTTNSI